MLPRILFPLAFSSICTITATADAADTQVGTGGNTIAAITANSNGSTATGGGTGAQSNTVGNGQPSSQPASNAQGDEGGQGDRFGTRQGAPEVTPGMPVPPGPWNTPRRQSDH